MFTDNDSFYRIEESLKGVDHVTIAQESDSLRRLFVEEDTVQEQNPIEFGSKALMLMPLERRIRGLKNGVVMGKGGANERTRVRQASLGDNFYTQFPLSCSMEQESFRMELSTDFDPTELEQVIRGEDMCLRPDELFEEEGKGKGKGGERGGKTLKLIKKNVFPKARPDGPNCGMEAHFRVNPGRCRVAWIFGKRWDATFMGSGVGMESLVYGLGIVAEEVKGPLYGGDTVRLG